MSGINKQKKLSDKDIERELEELLNSQDDSGEASSDGDEEEDDLTSVGSSIKENDKVSPIKIKTHSGYKIDKKTDAANRRDTNKLEGDSKTKKPRTPLKAIGRDANDSESVEKDGKKAFSNRTPVKQTPSLNSKCVTTSPQVKRRFDENIKPSLSRPQETELHSDFDKLEINTPDSCKRSARRTPRRKAAKATEADLESPGSSSEGETPRKRPKRAQKRSCYVNDDSNSDEDLAVPLDAAPSSPTRSTRPRRKTQPPQRYGTPRKDASPPLSESLLTTVLKMNTPRSSLPVKMRQPELSSPVRSAKKKLDLTPRTPGSARKIKIGPGFLSPCVPERTQRASQLTPSSLDLVRTQLHASSVPKCLPCREKEFNNIKSFIERKINDESGGCMYISGVPGTGKTASVHSVIRFLQEEAQNDEIPLFDFVEINGLRLTQPKEAYVRIWQTLTGKKLSAAEALNCLEKKFLKNNKRPTVLLVDELDYLCNRRQDVIYNILDWSTQRYSKLVVLTIANTMDLPERTLKGKVTSRMGLTRLVFHPYSFKQLEAIVQNRLAGSSTFHADAVQLIVRKVAAVSGDARRALDICRRATDIAEGDGREMVTVADVQKTLERIFKGSRVMAVKHCSKMAQFVLRALRDEILRTGVEESSVRAIYPQIVAISAFEGVREPTSRDVLVICSQLNDSGLIVAEKGRKDLSRKLTLNICADDVHFALNV